jgi:hypothetical protein
VADAVRNKSSLTHFSITGNAIGDKGRPGEEGKRMVMGREMLHGKFL